MTSKALPTKQRMHRLDTSDRITISLTPDMGIKKPNHPIVGIDLGRLRLKAGLLKDGETIYVEKVQNFLAELGTGASAHKSGSFAARNQRSSVKNELTINYRGKTYALGQKGAIAGGQTGLGEDKTVNLVLRILFVLTLLGLGRTPNEQVHLSIAIPFNNESFKLQERSCRSQLGSRLSWGTRDGMCSIELASLKVDPEDFHAEQFSRMISPDAPSFEGEWRETLGIGYQTFNVGIIDPDGYYDDTRSKSFEGKGTSLYLSGGSGGL